MIKPNAKPRLSTDGLANASEAHRITRKSWLSMHARCDDPSSSGYADYGALGVRVAPRWKSFAAFIQDVGLRPSRQHSLDRIDPRGNYEPGAVRWTTAREQSRNRTNNVWITFRGRTLCRKDWSAELGVSERRIAHRHLHGLPLDLPTERVPRACRSAVSSWGTREEAAARRASLHVAREESLRRFARGETVVAIAAAVSASASSVRRWVNKCAAPVRASRKAGVA